jgi:hypothetical protein
MHLELDFTEEEMKGIYYDPQDCPIARALKKAGAEEVCVKPNTIKFIFKGTRYTIHNTHDIQELDNIIYDLTEKITVFKPFKVNLKLI